MHNSEDNTVIFSSDYFSGKHFLKTNASPEMHYYYRYQGKLFNFEECTEVLALQAQLVNDRAYQEAKIFNEFLIDVSALKDMEEWLFYPMIIQLEHTNRCNARCIMCGHANVDKRRCFDISAETFWRIEKMLPFCKYVGLHGYGEPFLTKDLSVFLETYRTYGVRLYANTNLSYLPEEYLPYIHDMFDELNISIDGFTKETFEKIRIGISFSSVIHNLEKLRKSCPDVRCNLHCTLMRQNIEEAPEAVEFARKYGISKIVFSEMIPLEANENEYDSLQYYPDVTSEYLQRAIGLAKQYQIQVVYPSDFALKPDPEKSRQQKYSMQKQEMLPRKTGLREDGLLFNRKCLDEAAVAGSGIRCRGICDVFRKQIYVDADGTMAACCVDGHHCTGHIADFEDILSYWKSNTVQMLRNSFAQGWLPDICRSCNYLLLHTLKELSIRKEG